MSSEVSASAVSALAAAASSARSSASSGVSSARTAASNSASSRSRSARNLLLLRCRVATSVFNAEMFSTTAFAAKSCFSSFATLMAMASRSAIAVSALVAAASARTNSSSASCSSVSASSRSWCSSLFSPISSSFSRFAASRSRARASFDCVVPTSSGYFARIASSALSNRATQTSLIISVAAMRPSLSISVVSSGLENWFSSHIE